MKLIREHHAKFPIVSCALCYGSLNDISQGAGVPIQQSPLVACFPPFHYARLAKLNWHCHTTPYKCQGSACGTTGSILNLYPRILATAPNHAAILSGLDDDSQGTDLARKATPDLGPPRTGLELAGIPLCRPRQTCDEKLVSEMIVVSWSACIH